MKIQHSSFFYDFSSEKRCFSSTPPNGGRSKKKSHNFKWNLIKFSKCISSQYYSSFKLSKRNSNGIKLDLYGNSRQIFLHIRLGWFEINTVCVFIVDMKFPEFESFFFACEEGTLHESMIRKINNKCWTVKNLNSIFFLFCPIVIVTIGKWNKINFNKTAKTRWQSS